MAGAALAVAVFVTAVVVSIETLRHGGGGQNPQRFIPLGHITAFGGLVTAGLLLRRNSAAHKRLMLLATISLLAAGFGRGLTQIHMSGRTIFFYAPQSSRELSLRMISRRAGAFIR